VLLLIRNFEKISICSWICPSQCRGKRSIQVLGNIAIKPHKLCAPSVEINKEIPKNARYFRRGAHKARELLKVFHFGLLHRKCTVKTITNMRFEKASMRIRGWSKTFSRPVIIAPLQLTIQSLSQFTSTRDIRYFLHQGLFAKRTHDHDPGSFTSTGRIRFKDRKHECLFLNYIEFRLRGKTILVQFWNCICTSIVKKAIWFWQCFNR